MTQPTSGSTGVASPSPIASGSSNGPLFTGPSGSLTTTQVNVTPSPSQIFAISGSWQYVASEEFQTSTIQSAMDSMFPTIIHAEAEANVLQIVDPVTGYTREFDITGCKVIIDRKEKKQYTPEQLYALAMSSVG